MATFEEVMAADIAGITAFRKLHVPPGLWTPRYASRMAMPAEEMIHAKARQLPVGQCVSVMGETALCDLGIGYEAMREQLEGIEAQITDDIKNRRRTVGIVPPAYSLFAVQPWDEFLSGGRYLASRSDLTEVTMVQPGPDARYIKGETFEVKLEPELGRLGLGLTAIEIMHHVRERPEPLPFGSDVATQEDALTIVQARRALLDANTTPSVY